MQGYEVELDRWLHRDELVDRAQCQNSYGKEMIDGINCESIGKYNQKVVVICRTFWCQKAMYLSWR